MIFNPREAATIDFESLPIIGRPHHPPSPVGVSVKLGTGKSRYYSWGHEVGKNNSTWEEARRAVGEAYDSGRPILMHHVKFDAEVAAVHLDLPFLPWDRYHDTMPALFLKDPYASTYALKPSADRLLGWKQEERDAVEDWLMKNQPLASRGIKLSTSKDSDFYVGAYIAFAPAELVAEYAEGDTDRTHGLGAKVLPELERRGMTGAYDRERRLLPVIWEMENQGVRVDVEALARDEHGVSMVLSKIDQWLAKRLRVRGEINWNSPDQLGAALVRAGVAELNKTSKGKWEVNKDALAAGIKDRQILHVLKRRAQLSTVLKTFIRPWLETASASGGFIYTDWYTTRRDKGKGTGGAKTGRAQSSPNFQNMAKEFEPLFRHEVTAEWAREHEVTDDEAAKLKASLPDAPFLLPPAPNVRAYVLPWGEDDVLIDRDYSQQEPRILAHFEQAVEGGGRLLEAYLANPWIDFHDDAKAKLEAAGRHYKRKVVKGFNLGIMYGMGVGLMAERSGLEVNEARQVRNAIYGIYPGLKEMYREMERRAKAKEPIVTWGGREIFCEEPKVIDGKIVHFDYKMVNTLIQGSAADCTKEAMIRIHNAKPKWMKLLLSIHDEMVASVPRAKAREGMELLRSCMESIEFDVAMLSEGTWSDESFGALQPYDKKGQLVATKLAA
jgi:DNA polymerase I-like protein with 3'-5' exonuclease and polymerase domains